MQIFLDLVGVDTFVYITRLSRRWLFPAFTFSTQHEHILCFRVYYWHGIHMKGMNQSRWHFSAQHEMMGGGRRAVKRWSKNHILIIIRSANEICQVCTFALLNKTINYISCSPSLPHKPKDKTTSSKGRNGACGMQETKCPCLNQTAERRNTDAYGSWWRNLPPAWARRRTSELVCMMSLACAHTGLLLPEDKHGGRKCWHINTWRCPE